MCGGLVCGLWVCLWCVLSDECTVAVCVCVCVTTGFVCYDKT